MSRRVRKGQAASAESRSTRDRRRLDKAKLTQAPQTASPDVVSARGDRTTAAGRAVAYTFDWEGDGTSPLRPRLLRDDEQPDLGSSSLRILVNLTAKGSPTPAQLAAVLLNEESEQIARAIVEGIHRWHRYGRA
jgi:hypothetical protein